MENIDDWKEIVDEVFDYNYVKGDPSKFLNALEGVLKEKGYPGPSNPKRPNTFGMNTSGNYVNRVIDNFKAIEGLKSDSNNRPLDRYIMQDILVDKFFNGDQDTAGKAYQNWLKSRGEYLPYTDYNGAEMNIFKSIDDIPIWTPNNDVVSYMGDKFYFDYLFGGRHYKPYKEQDRKKKEDEEYYKNRAEGKYRDVCPRCRSSADMKWVNSEDDYPKGIISKEEFCSKCNPSGKPLPMSPQRYLIDCDICGVVVDNESQAEKTKENAEYWKARMDGYEGVPNLETNPTYLEYKRQYEYFKKQQDANEAKKCKCSFEKLKAVYDRYMEYEDYDSLANMQKNPLYKTFFDELNKNQNLTESIQRIKSIMKLL